MRRRLIDACWAWSPVFAGGLAALLVLLNTDLHAPPRYDGAGYSVLAESLMSGRGYRSIDHPDAPLHTHFPPGYPLALAVCWSLFGRSEVSAHVFSLICTSIAVVMTASWFMRLERRQVAGLLGLAISINWTWGRVGGAIQSEPLFLLLGQGALLLSATGSLRQSLRRSVGVGFLLGLATLTRHVGVCLLAAVVIERLFRRRYRQAGVVLITAVVVLAPWVWWLATARGPTQAALVESSGLFARILEQGLFYVRRIPDQILGPVVEIATVFGRSRAISLAATFFAFVATAIIALGWVQVRKRHRRRIVTLIPACTLPLLLVWPFTEAGRFLIPLVPVLLLGFVAGLGAVAGRFGINPRKSMLALVMIGLSVPYPAYALISHRAEAQRRTQADFDSACRWIVEQGHPGVILTRHPGEAYWQTRHLSLAVEEPSPEGVEKRIKKYHVTYLLVDDDRFARAPTSPLGLYAARHPDRVRLVREGPTRVFEVAAPE